MENPFQFINGKLSLIEQQINAITLDLIPDLAKNIHIATNPQIQKFGNARMASERYGVHFNTIRNWARQGYINKHMVDGVSLYSFDEIDAFVASKVA